MHAGTISTVYEADAGDLLAAQAKIAQVVKASSKVWDDLRAKLGVAAKAYDDVGDAAESVGRKGGAALPKLTADAERAFGKLSALRQRAGDLDNSMGKLQTAVGGLSGAFGGASGSVGALIGGVADLSMSFASGGPLLAAAALAGTAIAGVAGEFAEMEKKASDAKRAAVDSLRAVASSIEGRREAADLRLTGALTGITDKDELRLAAATAEATGLEMELRAVNGLEDPGMLGRWFESDAITEARARLAGLREEIGRLKRALEGARGLESWEVPEALAATASGRAARPAASPSAALPASLYDASASSAFESSMRAAHVGPAAMETITWDELNAELFPEVTTINHDLDSLDAGLQAVTATTREIHSPLVKFDNALRDSLPGLDGFVAALASSGFGAAGAAIAGAVGTAVGAAFGDVTGVIGGAIGSLLGSIFGDSLDALIDTLGVLRPLFDGVAVVIAALTPILVVVKTLMGAWGEVLALAAPSLEALARPLAALLLVAVRWAELMVPLIGVAVGVSSAMLRLLDVVTVGVGWLDDRFFRPLVSGARWLYNGFADVVNTIIEWIRSIPGFADFGVKMTTISTYVDDVISGFGKTVEEGADKVAQAFEGAETNIPVGYRVPYYDAEVPDGRESAGVAGGGASITTIYNIGTLKLVPTKPRISEALREELLQLRGRSVFQPGGDDDTN